MAALTEVNQIVKREELADYISMVDAKSTPFTSMAPKEAELGNTLFSWSVSAYDAPHGTASSVPDGDDVSAYDSTNRTKISNYGQTFRRAFGVGFLAQEVSNVAGIGKRKEMQWQTARKIVELKRDMEAAFCSTDQYAVADNGTVGYLTKPLGDFIHASGGSGSGATGTVVAAAFRTPSASIDATATASLADTNIQALIASIYGQTGVVKSYTGIVGTTLKRAFTALTQGKSTTTGATNVYTQSAVRTFNQELGSSVYRNSISVFEGDFGTIELVPSAFIGTTTTSSGAALVAEPYRGYVIDWELVALRYGMFPKVEDLPNSGGGPKKMITAFAGLVVKNPLGLGKFNASS